MVIQKNIGEFVLVIWKIVTSDKLRWIHFWYRNIELCISVIVISRVAHIASLQENTDRSNICKTYQTYYVECLSIAVQIRNVDSLTIFISYMWLEQNVCTDTCSVYKMYHA